MNMFEMKPRCATSKVRVRGRRLRRSGKVPGILYGARSEPVSIQVGQADILLRTELEAFYSHILTLKLDGTLEKVRAQGPAATHLQARYPASGFSTHRRIGAAHDACAPAFR